MDLETSYIKKENKELNGIELYFDNIPTYNDREILKNNNYRWNKVKKCWYKKISNNETIKEIKKYNSLIELTTEEKEELSKKLWSTEDMQKYLVETYDFYKTSDNLIIELQKVNKITIDKTMYYDDETEGPEKNENNFIIYNRYNFPIRSLNNYLEEKENLKIHGCASGQYDYKGLYLVNNNYKHKEQVSVNWFDQKDDKYFIRYMTEEEQKDYIDLLSYRNNLYIERLKKYYKKYNKHVSTCGYWVNR